jgi:hypothetical protein
MEGLIAQTESWEEAEQAVHTNLMFEFRNQVPHDVIADVARQSVEDLHRKPIRIMTFVPLLALRRARDRLRGSFVTPNPEAFGSRTAS